MKKNSGLIILVLIAAILFADAAFARYYGREKRILGMISTPGFSNETYKDHCKDTDKYIVYLIDNFTQTLNIVPEVSTSHGEMLLKMLLSGRQNIEVKTLNTTLSSGLARTINDLLEGKCIDAVVSSTPGSNYTYNQISSLFQYKVKIDSENLLLFRRSLSRLMKRIALRGFPSVQWLKQIDVNPVKLKSDAITLSFIEALKRFKVPIFLPYGNSDSFHRGQLRTINILSLAQNAKVYSALDQFGNRVPDFPYSPLSSGDERAIFKLRECPDPENPFFAQLDINEDGYYDYRYQKKDDIAYVGENGKTLFAPPVLSTEAFSKLKRWMKKNDNCTIFEEMVLTQQQYKELKEICTRKPSPETHYSYVWINSVRYQKPFHFNARCWNKGQISGTSFIPPNKVKEFLP